MADLTNIEWCDATFNPWEGCQKVGPGCDHCYAETRNARFGGGVAPNWGPNAPRRRTSAANWRKPRAWQRDAARFMAEHGRRQRVFCASLADVFDKAVPAEWRTDLFELIRATPDLDWLLLTKRVGNVEAIARAAGGLPKNVWLGVTVVNQTEADRDVPKLLAAPARVRFLSMEPLLGPVDLTRLRDGDMDALAGKAGMNSCPRMTPELDWIIVGGESGPDARPMHPDWARSLRDQCAAAGVPFLFKQWGEWREWDDGNGNPEPEEIDNASEYADWVFASAVNPGFISNDGNTFTRENLPEEEPCRLVERVGKHRAGRLLDGVQHDGVPVAPG